MISRLAPVPLETTRQTVSLIPLSHLFLAVVAFAYLLALHGRKAHPRAPVPSCPSPTLSVNVYRVRLIRPRLRRCRGFASKFSPVTMGTQHQPAYIFQTRGYLTLLQFLLGQTSVQSLLHCIGELELALAVPRME